MAGELPQLHKINSQCDHPTLEVGSELIHTLDIIIVNLWFCEGTEGSIYSVFFSNESFIF